MISKPLFSILPTRVPSSVFRSTSFITKSSDIKIMQTSARAIGCRNDFDDLLSSISSSMAWARRTFFYRFHSLEQVIYHNSTKRSNIGVFFDISYRFLRPHILLFSLCHYKLMLIQWVKKNHPLWHNRCNLDMQISRQGGLGQ